ncbi:MAG: GspE/PulE family protein [Planctomycetes bacterium]|nr:GspE/PulE family protein [Planctomycetota bacterium]
MNRPSSVAAMGNQGPPAPFAALVDRAARRDPQFATDFVSTVLRSARDAGASDVHLDPTTDALDVRWRLDGVLQPLVRLPREVAANVTARLKVLAGLLTYESALPQEGRIWDDTLRAEVRVSTFPTLYGERSVLRLLGASRESLDSLDDLAMPSDVLCELERNLSATSGAILIVGPAGSGKTTSAYACLRHIVARSGGGRSIASLEDPIEVAVNGVAQTQVNAAVEFDMATGLRSLLRLDPEVILIGEMRDRPTAEIALQAALTGQLVVTTFHAGDCRDALNRLLDIGIPTYAVRNAVRLVVAQRLLRRLCKCAGPGDPDRDARPLGLNVTQCRIPGACDDCHHTGFRGRTLVAEYQTISSSNPEFPQPAAHGLWSSAQALVERGTTTAAEVVRVLGLPPT